jgi:tRNA U34 2-thiouridine synthase MnmA/TrmU
MDDYIILKTSLTVIRGATIEDDDVLVQCNKTLERAYTTEFEYKVAKHMQKTRNKKEALNKRIAEFNVALPKADWKVCANQALVMQIDEILKA